MKWFNGHPAWEFCALWGKPHTFCLIDRNKAWSKSTSAPHTARCALTQKGGHYGSVDDATFDSKGESYTEVEQ